MTPDPKVSAHYQGEAGARYVAHHQADPHAEIYAIEAEAFRPYLRPTDVVLDFGCANGGVARHLRHDVARIEGLEVNPHSAVLARSLGFDVFDSLEALPTGQRYDVIYSNHVLEHVRDPAATLEALRTRMKPGARLLLKLPIDDWRSRPQRRWVANDVDHHLHTWTPRLAGNLLYESGFAVDHIRVVTSAYHPKLLPLRRVPPLARLAFWALSVLKKRRQLFLEAHNPG